MKQCRTCSADLPLGEFYRHDRMADGHLNVCKACVRDRVKRYSKTERGREVERKRNAKPERQRSNRERADKWRRNNQDAFRAQTSVNNAVRDGRLVKAVACEECGATDRSIHAHHRDYAVALEVVWLCVVCHKAEHIGRPQLSIFGWVGTQTCG